MLVRLVCTLQIRLDSNAEDGDDGLAVDEVLSIGELDPLPIPARQGASRLHRA